MKLIGLDPSWKELGICTIDTDTKELFLQSKEFEFKAKQPYNVYKFTVPIMKFIEEYVKGRSNGIKVCFGMEYHSTYGAYMQGEMMALDNLIIHTLSTMDANIDISLYYQTYLTYVLGHKSSDKEATVTDVTDLIEIFKKHEYKISDVTLVKTRKYGDRLTGGEGDSFVYTIRQMIKNKDEINDEVVSKIIKEILEKFPKFADVKELG